MNTRTLLAVALLAAAPFAAQADEPWIGTANYGFETVGPFNTYDFSSSGVLLLEPQNATDAKGYYQSFVSQHLLDGDLIAAAGLNKNYEITVVANFTSTLTSNSNAGSTFEVTGGTFSLLLDTHLDHNFNSDSGFADGTVLMSGVVENGAGSLVKYSGKQLGGSDLLLKVTSYNTAVYQPNTLNGGESIFTLRLGAGVDNGFLNPISSVAGHTVAATDLKFAADGNMLLTAVPEPTTYAMLLAGLCMVGMMVKRRSV